MKFFRTSEKQSGRFSFESAGGVVQKEVFMYLYSLLSAATAVDNFEPIAKWLTIAVVAALLLTGVLLFFAKRKAFANYAKYALFGLICYLLALAVLFFLLDILKHSSDAYIEENGLNKKSLLSFMLVPLLCLSACILIGLTAFALISKYKPEKRKLVAILIGSVCLIALATTVVLLGIYYNKEIKNNEYYNSDSYSVKQLALYLGAVLAVAVIFALATLDKETLRFDARTLAYAGICVSMSFALSYIKLWDMPQGGSVTLVSLLPIMLFAYLFGAKKGVFVGFAYGVLQAVQDPWIIHPAQFLLDYPVAFASAGLAGLLRPVKKWEKLPQAQFGVGALIAGTMRFVCHVLSGVFAFESYAGGENVWLYSLAYNSYVFIDVALVIAAGVFVLSSKSFVKAVLKPINSNQ